MSADRPTPRPGVLGIAPYVPGKSTATGGATLHKLSSNETPLGPSSAAVAGLGVPTGRCTIHAFCLPVFLTGLTGGIAGQYRPDHFDERTPARQLPLLSALVA